MSHFISDSVVKDMNLTQNNDGSYTFHIVNSSGHGKMTGYFVSKNVFIATVDFSLSECPMYSSPNMDFSKWFTVNYCISGRCEVTLPQDKTCIVKQGDFCISGCERCTDKFYYPLNYYRGIELFLCTDLINEDTFSILRESGFSFESWSENISSSAAVFSNCTELNKLTDELFNLLAPFDNPGCKLKIMEILRFIHKTGLPVGGKGVYYSRTQIEIAKQTHKMLTSNIESTYNLNEIADMYKISLGTLNNYFKAVYGDYIPSYIRDFRMKTAAAMLSDSEKNVYDIAAHVGYSNPSKFSGAFKKAFGISPTEYRRKCRCDSVSFC